ncbi:MAG: ABC transporter permease subunit, partial [Solirubrobacteraceae bacterium]
MGSAVLGLGLALISAVHPRGVTDVLVRVISLAGNSLPIFWLGLLALYLFYARLGWLGGPGRLDDAYEYTIDMPSGFVLLDAWRSGVQGAFPNAVSHLILPVALLVAYAVGSIARPTRAALLAEAGTALFAGDTPAILGSTLVIGICFILINGVTDSLAHLLDPRT